MKLEKILKPTIFISATVAAARLAYKAYQGVKDYLAPVSEYSNERNLDDIRSGL